jgi:hypothetical protein
MRPESGLWAAGILEFGLRQGKIANYMEVPASARIWARFRVEILR